VFKTSPPIPLSLVRRRGTKEGEVKRPNFTLYGKPNSPYSDVYTGTFMLTLATNLEKTPIL
jgi:hypothetical protein